MTRAYICMKISEYPHPPVATVSQITTLNVIISSPLTKSVMPSKRNAAAKLKQSLDPLARLSPVPSPVSCQVISDDVQFKLQISNLKSLAIKHDALHYNSLLKMIFSTDTSVFIPESFVSDNPIRYERPRMSTNDHEYYHDTTRNDPDPATVELRFRPRPQSNTIHTDEFKRFKLVVALSWRFSNHQDSSRITTVLLGLAPLRCYYDSCRCITT